MPQELEKYFRRKYQMKLFITRMRWIILKMPIPFLPDVSVADEKQFWTENFSLNSRMLQNDENPEPTTSVVLETMLRKSFFRVCEIMKECFMCWIIALMKTFVSWRNTTANWKQRTWYSKQLLSSWYSFDDPHNDNGWIC